MPLHPSRQGGEPARSRRFTWITQMSHVPMLVDDDVRRDWPTQQALTTCNVAGSAFNDWFTGHLNYQGSTRTPARARRSPPTRLTRAASGGAPRSGASFVSHDAAPPVPARGAGCSEALREASHTVHGEVAVLCAWRHSRVAAALRRRLVPSLLPLGLMRAPEPRCAISARDGRQIHSAPRLARSSFPSACRRPAARRPTVVRANVQTTADPVRGGRRRPDRRHAGRTRR